jgi:Uncharacterised nucleotidyltransferase
MIEVTAIRRPIRRDPRVVRADERRRTERGTNSPSEVGHRIDSRSGDTVSTRVPTLGQDERRLLLRCARIELGTEREAEVTELLRAPLDWDAILFFARLHSVGSLLHRHVKRLGDPALVPDRARRGLLALYQRADYRNRMFARENTRLVEAMGTAGIPVIVQKGLPLAELVYGSLALRPLIDLIFMVPRGELMATGELLVSQGYSARPQKRRLQAPGARQGRDHQLGAPAPLRSRQGMGSGTARRGRRRSGPASVSRRSGALPVRHR